MPLKCLTRATTGHSCPLQCLEGPLGASSLHIGFVASFLPPCPSLFSILSSLPRFVHAPGLAGLGGHLDGASPVPPKSAVGLILLRNIAIYHLTWLALSLAAIWYLPPFLTKQQPLLTSFVLGPFPSLAQGFAAPRSYTVLLLVSLWRLHHQLFSFNWYELEQTRLDPVLKVSIHTNELPRQLQNAFQTPSTSSYDWDFGLSAFFGLPSMSFMEENTAHLFNLWPCHLRRQNRHLQHWSSLAAYVDHLANKAIACFFHFFPFSFFVIFATPYASIAVYSVSHEIRLTLV